MNKKQGWSMEEDDLLTHLASKTHLRNRWTQIANQINVYFPDKTRLAKQCRDRFINYISRTSQPGPSTVWNEREVGVLMARYKQLGPRWTEISNHLSGKSENCVKNKFYGTLRKVIRKMNMRFRCACKKTKKEIRLKSVMKILQYAEGRYRFDPELFHRSSFLRDMLLLEASGQKAETTTDQLLQLITQINEFNIITRSFRPVKRSEKQFCEVAQDSVEIDEVVKGEDRSRGSQDRKEIQQSSWQAKQHSGSLQKQNQDQFPQILLRELSKQHRQKENGKMVELEWVSHPCPVCLRQSSPCFDHLWSLCSPAGAEFEW